MTPSLPDRTAADRYGAPTVEILESAGVRVRVVDGGDLVLSAPSAEARLLANRLVAWFTDEANSQDGIGSDGSDVLLRQRLGVKSHQVPPPGPGVPVVCASCGQRSMHVDVRERRSA